MVLRLHSLSLRCTLLLLLAIAGVVANVEKVVFNGPAAANIPLAKPSFADLNLDSLTPESSVVRTNLSRTFASDPEPRGTSAWLLLDRLVEGQRYEVRVCWAAIEPTSFTLDVHEPDTVWGNPELIQSLARYASNRQTDPVTNQQASEARRSSAKERTASVLFLRVQAAADYFADDVDLMAHPPPVLVDLILDPFLYNVVPRSLIPTAGYLVLVGVVTWFLARWISSRLQVVAAPPKQDAKKRD